MHGCLTTQSSQACPSCLSWGHTSSSWRQNHLVICIICTEIQAYPKIYKQVCILSLGNSHLRLHLCLCAPDMSSEAEHVARVKGLVVQRVKGFGSEPRCFASPLSQGLSPLLHCTTTLSMQVISERGIPSKSKGSRLKIVLGVDKADTNGKAIGQGQTSSAY